MFFTIRLHKRVLAAVVILLALCFIGGAELIGAQATKIAPTDEISLPIIMYHSLLKDPARQGKYVVSPELFEQDLQYLQKNGYHTVLMKEVIAFVENGTPLPEKPIMLTFDDGYYNNYVYAYPLLKKYDSRMVLSPIGRYSDEYTKTRDLNPNYAHCDWDTLREMSSSGLVEMLNHTYNLHSTDAGRKGAQKLKTETQTKYHDILCEDILKMQNVMEENLGGKPIAFTYPYGAISKESLPILKELGFKATLICESRINVLTNDSDCLYGLGRYLRPCKTSSEAYFKKILK